MFIELPDDNSSDKHCKMKIGDGNTVYENLPYAMGIGDGKEKIFTGTRQEWNSLSNAEQLEYMIVNITDDTSSITSDTTVDFISADVDDSDADGWSGVTKLTSGLSLSTLFQRVSQMFRNIRYLNNSLEIGVYVGDSNGGNTTYTSSLYQSDTHYFIDVGKNFDAGDYLFTISHYTKTTCTWLRTVFIPQSGTSRNFGTRREDGGTTNWKTTYSFVIKSQVPFSLYCACFNGQTSGSFSYQFYEYTINWVRIRKW